MNKFKPDWATHPADHIAEYLKVRGWSQADLVRAAGLPRGRVSELLSRKRSITPEIAVKLEKAFGLSAHIWLGLQSNWDLHEARKRSEK